MDTTCQDQLDLFETLLQTPVGSRIIDRDLIKLYAEVVKVNTGDLMLIRPIPGPGAELNRYLIILPY